MQNFKFLQNIATAKNDTINIEIGLEGTSIKDVVRVNETDLSKVQKIVESNNFESMAELKHAISEFIKE